MKRSLAEILTVYVMHLHTRLYLFYLFHFITRSYCIIAKISKRAVHSCCLWLFAVWSCSFIVSMQAAESKCRLRSSEQHAAYRGREEKIFCLPCVWLPDDKSWRIFHIFRVQVSLLAFDVYNILCSGASSHNCAEKMFLHRERICLTPMFSYMSTHLQINILSS